MRDLLRWRKSGKKEECVCYAPALKRSGTHTNQLNSRLTLWTIYWHWGYKKVVVSYAKYIDRIYHSNSSQLLSQLFVSLCICHSAFPIRAELEEFERYFLSNSSRLLSQCHMHKKLRGLLHVCMSRNARLGCSSPMVGWTGIGRDIQSLSNVCPLFVQHLSKYRLRPAPVQLCQDSVQCLSNMSRLCQMAVKSLSKLK